MKETNLGNLNKKIFKNMLIGCVFFFIAMLLKVMGLWNIGILFSYAFFLSIFRGIILSVKLTFYGNKEVVRNIKNNEFPLPDLYFNDEKSNK